MRNTSLSAAFSFDEYKKIEEFAKKIGLSKSVLIRSAVMFVAMMEPSLISTLSILTEPELAVELIKEAVENA